MKLNDEAFKLLKERELVKGDAISIAEIAGIMAAKKTSDLVSAESHLFLKVDTIVSPNCIGFCQGQIRL